MSRIMVTAARFDWTVMSPPYQAVTVEDVLAADVFPVLSMSTGATPGPILMMPHTFLFGGAWTRHELEEFARLRGVTLGRLEVHGDAAEIAAGRLGAPLVAPAQS